MQCLCFPETLASQVRSQTSPGCASELDCGMIIARQGPYKANVY